MVYINAIRICINPNSLFLASFGNVTARMTNKRIPIQPNTSVDMIIGINPFERFI